MLLKLFQTAQESNKGDGPVAQAAGIEAGRGGRSSRRRASSGTPRDPTQRPTSV